MNELLTLPGTDRAEAPDASAELDGTLRLPTNAQSRTFQPHFMLVPSLACPAECSYCFGPHTGPVMSAAMMEATLDFMTRIVAETGQRKVKVTFHGGEPLMAGHALWRQALEGMESQFGPGGYKVALQSNLWFLDDEFCEMFRQHKVEIGTSLDGPEHLTDQQRGSGYFARTMTGIRKAQSHGMTVGCIATFTPLTLPHWKEVFDFFLTERLGFSIHAAVPPLNGKVERASRPFTDAQAGSLRHYLTPAEYGRLLRQMLDYYIEHRRELAVSSLDQMCQGFGCGDGKVCTFRDCLGMFLAIDPTGDIYPCQRFCGKPQYRLGSLVEQPTLEGLFASPTAQRFASRQAQTRKACDGCAHFAYCKGGCAYNAWVAEGNDPHPDPLPYTTWEWGSPRPRCLGERPAAPSFARTGEGNSSCPNPSVVDPYCAAYRETFDYIRQRLLTEMASEENINAVAERPFTGTGNPLLRKGPLIELVREGPHPSQIARTAKRIVAAVELAKGPDIPTVGTRLVTMGVCRTQQTAEASLNNLWQQLHPAKVALNNLYLHVTFGCQLRCTHCYAHAGNDAVGRAGPPGQPLSDSGTEERRARRSRPTSEMSVSALDKIIREAHEAGFRQVIITGGEPLTHPQRDEMLEMLAEWRNHLGCASTDDGQAGCSPHRKMNLVLRTNFAMPLSNDDLRRIAAAFDQVVASVDGTEETHDARRGPGTYAAVVRNLENYTKLATDGHRLPQMSESEKSIRVHPCESVANHSPAELSLACVMRAVDIQGEAGHAVRQLAHRLGIRRTRFRPLLPLGRAADWDEPPQSEALGAHADPMELIKNGFHPVASCGLGQNLYVEPSGESFPCYAYHQPHSFLGNVIENRLSAILQTERFQDLSRHTVDTNPKCRACDVRYLCGGACRAWGGAACQRDLDALPPECDGLRARAAKLLAAATEYLDHQPAPKGNHPPCSNH